MGTIFRIDDNQWRSLYSRRSILIVHVQFFNFISTSTASLPLLWDVGSVSYRFWLNQMFFSSRQPRRPRVFKTRNFIAMSRSYLFQVPLSKVYLKESVVTKTEYRYVRIQSVGFDHSEIFSPSSLNQLVSKISRGLNSSVA